MIEHDLSGWEELAGRAAAIRGRLRNLREDAGLTMRDLAAKAGVSISMVSRLESSHVEPPSAAAVERIARTLLRSRGGAGERLSRSLAQALRPASAESAIVALRESWEELATPAANRSIATGPATDRAAPCAVPVVAEGHEPGEGAPVIDLLVVALPSLVAPFGWRVGGACAALTGGLVRAGDVVVIERDAPARLRERARSSGGLFVARIGAAATLVVAERGAGADALRLTLGDAVLEVRSGRDRGIELRGIAVATVRDGEVIRLADA